MKDKTEKESLQYKGFLNTEELLLDGLSIEIPNFDMGANKVSNSELVPIPKNIVLGKRIEYLFQSYINGAKNYELIAKNIQIIKDKITIGELDFIVKDKVEDRLIHVELVYKFYLLVGVEKSLDCWVGPNRNDSLVKRIEKLTSKQFPLLKSETTKSVLHELGVNTDDIEQEICFLGNLFVPHHLKNVAITTVNQNCVKGWWVNLDGFVNLKLEQFKFAIPDKQDWILSPCQSGSEWLSFEEFSIEIELFHNRKRSPLCWLSFGDELYECFFVVWWS